MTTIAIINLKGGVAKTTSTLALAQILSDEHHKRVLVVDCDKQANATQSLIGSLPEGTLTTADLLTAKEPVAAQAILGTGHGVDLIPASFALLEANQVVMFDPCPRERRLADQLATVADRYDYCLIDCPPDINIVVTNVLHTADDVLVPIRADRYGFDGMEYTFGAIEKARQYRSSLRIAGCFLTMLSTNTRLSEVSKGLLSRFGTDLTFRTAIRQCTKVGESTFGEPLLSYAPHCTAAEDYRDLLKEYLERTEQSHG